MAAASSSKNANGMMKAVRLPSGRSLLDIFNFNVCGWDLPLGKPNPAIFLLAAQGLGIEPEACFVVEDAPAGNQGRCRRRHGAAGDCKIRWTRLFCKPPEPISL